MENVINSPVEEWSTAIHNLDLERVKALLNMTPDLLWNSVTLPKSQEHAYLVDELQRCQQLGNELTNLAAIPYLLLDFDDESTQQLKRARLFEFLLSHATPDDLDTRSWGSCGDKTVHLAAFMGHGQQELIARGASITVSNDLGHLPLKTPRFVKKQSSVMLRKPIEKPKGGSQEELLKHKTQRKQDIDSLAKRSAVKNNPLFKKFEHQQPPSSTSLQKRTLGVLSNDKIDLIRKNSKVISSLKTKSIVSSSVFRQNAATSAVPVPRSSPLATPRKKTVPEAGDTKTTKATETFDLAAQSSGISGPETKQPSAPAKKKDDETVMVVADTVLATKDELKEIKTNSHVEFEPSTCDDKPLKKKVVMPPSPLAIVTAPSILSQPDSPTLEPESHQQLMANHMQNELARKVVDISPPEIEFPLPDVTGENDCVFQQQNDYTRDAVDLVEPGSLQQTALEELAPTEPSSVKTSPHFTYTTSVNNIPHLIPATLVTNITAAFLEEQKEDCNDENESVLPFRGTVIEETIIPIESQPLERESPLALTTMGKYDKNKIGFDDWYDSYDEWDDGLSEPPSLPQQPSHSKRQSISKDDFDESSIASATPPASFSPQQRMSTGTESIDTLPPPCVKDDDVIPPVTSTQGEEYGSISVQSTSYYANDTQSEKVPSILSSSRASHNSVENTRSDEDSDSVYSYMAMKVEVEADTHPVPGTSVHSPQNNDLQSINLDFREMSPLKLNEHLIGESIKPTTDDGRDMVNQQRHDSDAYQSTGKYNSLHQYHAEDDDRDVENQQCHDSASYQSTEKYDTYQQYHGEDDSINQRNQQHHLNVDNQNSGKYDTHMQEHMEDADWDMRGKQHHKSVTYQSSEKYESHEHHCAEEDEPVFNQYNNYGGKFRAPSGKFELPEVVNHPGQSTSAFGKLYVRVSSAENILLPLPNESAYVRAVVSDGQYEFMSRYEELGPKVLFDYECIIDAQPDMIVTLAIHVRPDPHVKPKTGLTKWFAPTYYNQREMITGYVHPEDGAIGQSRFALGHMIQACNQKVYRASFDCFNSWYARSSRERHREQMGHDDILKVVASLSVEMLYLPVMDPSMPVPQSLRECDLALRIRQWHDTCWHSGYMSICQEDAKSWQRHYFRLIGSQLLGFAGKTAPTSESCVQYDIADALRITTSSDKVMMALVDDQEESHQLVFQSDMIAQETSQGYFRITFTNTYIEFVCDELETWVKILRSMIGRVPLGMPLPA